MPLPVADQWFVRKSHDDDVTLITEPHVHPFLRCNIWHIQGRDADLLIDTGMGIADLTLAARDLFTKKLNVVLTHSHVDHSGGVHEFDNCFMHKEEMDLVTRIDSQLPLATQHWPEDILAMMKEDGAVDEYVITARPDTKFEPDAYQQLSAKKATVIGEGDVIDLGNRAFEVMHLPGHSPGSIGLWEVATKTLFSGDAIYDAQLLDELPGSDQSHYQATMRRLLELPASVVHGGHDESFGRSRLIEIATDYLNAFESA
ncbi:MAG: MBL fold metallo-hydrolase [Pseudomonadales bacterium]|nr:MBL fold metallo-hydrolase [Pseudomonadales bacterium]